MKELPKRLIEVDLPIKRISAHARREKSIRHGHISTLHIWWARRPLAACRAVILAALWPDPADQNCPERFRREARRLMLLWAAHHADKAGEESFERLIAVQKNQGLLDDPLEVRRLLLDFIADFANWDTSSDADYLATARALVQIAHESLGGTPGTKPLVVDPFAGGGSIPLEALRAGADVFASDLNPIPVLLNKAMLEYVPSRGPALAAEVRQWGAAIKREAAVTISRYYPQEADGSTPIAYIWSRTVRCEGPGCGVEFPLFTSPWLSKRQGRYRWLAGTGGRGHKQFEIRESARVPLGGCAGTIRKGAATCPACGYTTPMTAVKRQLSEAHGGARNARLLAVVLSGADGGGRHYRTATDADISVADRAHQQLSRLRLAVTPPQQVINPVSPGKFGSGIASPTRIGCRVFADLFTGRQLLALCTFADRVSRVGDPAIRTLLAFAVDRLADYNSAHSRWAAAGEFVGNTFGRQAIPIVWSFAETNPFSGASGDWDGAIRWISGVVEHVAASVATPGAARRCAASAMPLPDDAAHLLFTDPPYYGSILYSDLADYFYVWLRQTLAGLHTELLQPDLINKTEEVVATPTSPGPDGVAKDATYFESAMSKALADARRVLGHTGIGTVVFAHKSTSGWEALLSGLITAGWTVTASWPIDTERQARTNAHGTATLASSVHLVCRPRHAKGGLQDVNTVGDWRDVLAELPRRIHQWMPRLSEAGVVGADAIFSCLGPALEVFSRYSKVEKASGEQVALRDYLEHVWAAVAREALTMVFEGADAAGFEEDARLTAIWLWTLSAGVNERAAESRDDDGDSEAADDEESGASAKAAGKVPGFALEFDAARKIAQGLGAHLEALGSVVEVKGETAFLLHVDQRAAALFGKDAASTTGGTKRTKRMQLALGFAGDGEDGEADAALDIRGMAEAGKTVLDRVHQAMLLFAGGRGAAMKRFLVDDGVGKDERFWRLAQALSALYPSGTNEKRWVDGVLARKKGLGFG